MDREELRAGCRRLDGRQYPAYKDLRGRWDLGEVLLSLDHVQGDPFAAPSRLRLRVQTGLAALAADPDARLAAEDWLLRRFAAALPGARAAGDGRDRRSGGGGRARGGERRGSGRSGEITVYRPGPEIVERSALRLLADGRAEVRFSVGLPAGGRRILGRQAAALLLEDVPGAARALMGVADDPGLAAQVASVRAQRALRRQLAPRGLVAFVADGAVLPRASGISQAPLAGAVAFESPPSLRVTLETPGGPVPGMGVPSGVTLIVGGGFHGKSTLLMALQRGPMDHIPGDGRERVVALPGAVKIRAEDGRRVAGVDISPFLRDLPGGRSTAPFTTDDASGSTSQAAAIVEAAEGGAEVLLIDEDTSATNLLVRDERMRALIPREREPITPFVERVRQVREGWGLSTVMVVGGVGDYLAVADTVIAMEDWRPRDVTAQARALAGEAPAAPGPLGALRGRVPLPLGEGAPGDRYGRDRPMKIRSRDARRLDFGGEEVELSAVEQVLDPAHAATLGHALRVLYEALVDGERDIRRLLDGLEALLDAEGVEALSPYEAPPGDLIRPRRHEVAAALSRLRTLQVRGRGPR
jgi:predicted ABC-class ATPase